MSLENLTLGTEIRGARERAGYTIAKVAEITRIRETLIKDIESDEFSSCGGNAYARGHIRTIAKVVNLNADQLIEKFAESTGDFDRPMIDLLEENNVVKVRSPRPQISYKALASVAAGVVALLVAVPGPEWARGSSYNCSSPPLPRGLPLRAGRNLSEGTLLISPCPC